MRQDLTLLSNDELIASLKKLVSDERERLVLVLRHLNEVDRRRLAIDAGFPALFDYCVRELRYAPGEAARRIHAARAAKKFPIVYRTLERGLLSLTTLSMLAAHLKWDNHRRLIRAAAGRSTREVEALVATLAPSQEPAEKIRFVSAAPDARAANDASPGDLFAQNSDDPERAATTPNPPSIAAADPPAAGAHGTPCAAEEPASPEPSRRVHFSFTADEALLRDVERARELLWHKSPAGKLERVFAEALKALLKSIDPDRRVPSANKGGYAGRAPGTRRRAVARAVRSAVWRRDGGRCAFLSPDGRRCGSRAGLELDHILPWARGGASDEDNLRLLCRAHNALAARRAFGDAAIDAAVAHRRSS